MGGITSDFGDPPPCFVEIDGVGFASTVTCKWIRVYAASPRQRPQAQRPGDMGGASVRLARVGQVCQLRELGGTQP